MKIHTKLLNGAIAFLSLTLAACGGGWMGDEEKQPLPGERISVLEMQRRLEPD